MLWFSIADRLIRHRKQAWLLFIVISLISVAGYLPDRWRPGKPVSGQSAEETDDPRPAYRGWKSDFGIQRSDCIVVIEAKDILTPVHVAALRDLAAELDRLETIDSLFWMDSLPGLNVFGVTSQLVPPADASPERFLNARREVLNHPLLAGHWISPDATTAVMTLTFDWLEVTSDDDVSSKIRDTANTVFAEHPQSELRVRLTGDVPLFLAQDRSFKRNESKFRIIGYVLAILVAGILFRGIIPVFITAGAPGIGIFWTLGLLRLFDVELNPLTNVVLPVLLAMVGIADGVHLMVSIRQQRAAGVAQKEAVRRALRQVGSACGLTSITTSVGFCSLMLAHSEFVASFGRACAIGVLVMFVAVSSTIPLLCLTRLGRNIHRGYERDVVGMGLQRWSRSIDWIVLRKRPVSLTAIFVTLLLGATTLTLKPDTRISYSLPTTSEAYQALAHCDRMLGGIEYARIVYEWPEDCSNDSPAIIGAVADIEEVLRREELIGNPISIRSVLTLFPGDDADIASRLEFIELLPDNIRDVFHNAERRRGLVTMRIQDLGLAIYEPIFARIDQALKQLEEKHPGFVFELTGSPVNRGRTLYRIVIDLAVSLGTASLIILLIMTLAYRSLRLGLITVVPNLFPLAATGSLLVLIGRPLDIASVCAFTVCLGIAVDDTIHFLSRYRQLQAEGQDTIAAIRSGFFQVGAALIMTTIIMVVGFGAVLSSDLPSQRIFAAMACCTISSALIGDMIFLPAMLAWLMRR